jgi:hypothetical protein
VQSQKGLGSPIVETHCYHVLSEELRGVIRGKAIMGKGIATATAVSTLFGLLVALGVVALGAHQAQAAPTKECLSGPNGVSPKGQHWYYRLDRATQRKCWYLRSADLGRETAEDLTVDKRKAQAIEPPKSSAPGGSISADAKRALTPGSSAAQTYANAVPAIHFRTRAGGISRTALSSVNSRPRWQSHGREA